MGVYKVPTLAMWMVWYEAYGTQCPTWVTVEGLSFAL